jgi:hypothetical protein
MMRGEDIFASIIVAGVNRVSCTVKSLGHALWYWRDGEIEGNANATRDGPPPAGRGPKSRLTPTWVYR